MSDNKPCIRFGDLAVRMGYISSDQLEAALHIQQEENRSNRHRLIGLILFDEGWITTAQIEEVLKGIFLQPERPEKSGVAQRSG